MRAAPENRSSPAASSPILKHKSLSDKSLSALSWDSFMADSPKQPGLLVCL